MEKGSQCIHKTSCLHAAAAAPVVVVAGDMTDGLDFGSAGLKSPDATLPAYGVAMVHADDIGIGVWANCELRQASGSGSRTPNLIRLNAVFVGTFDTMLRGGR